MTLPKCVRPIEIHKPKESLYIVRFLEDRLYLVSFAQTNSLYMLDLNKSAVLYTVVELDIPGFGDFLSAVTKDLLLALGQSA
ncbi:beta-propeller domain-containing protein [Zhongshania sp.]|jgi:inhibitor of cysteine peptidase|uniref:beta-propeller domain-containing protein n=1 Tax=Zhongshania sp. TaxID=1971902 RepID=UPI0039E287ED